MKNYWYIKNMKLWGLGFLIFISLSGCHKYVGSSYTPSDIHTVPDTFEPLDHFPRKLPGQLPAEKENLENSHPVKTNIPASSIIQIAQTVIETEAEKLGTACNRFVLRVLNLAGFANVNFLANDFDKYAKKYLKDFTSVTFLAAKSQEPNAQLKKFLWSYPERTAFIFQWKRATGHGHIALVERISDKLVIYQASLRTQIPHKDQTKIQSLLNLNGRSHLIVYTAAL